MNPVLFTTPRTGSTLICSLLADIFDKKNLNEFFRDYPINYQKTNGIVVGESFKEILHSGPPWLGNFKDEQLRRLDLIKGNYSYIFKLFGDPLEPEILTEIKNNYDIIFLERKNKIRQILSFSLLVKNNTTHYTKHDKKINSIIYKPWVAKYIIDNYTLYKKFKSELSSNFTTIYYEDFIEQGANHSALLSLLKLPIEYKSNIRINDNWIHKDSAPTPYSSDNLEDLIVNKKTWLRDKENILEKLKD